MRIKLLESGIQNIKQLAKQYHKAIIYCHIDLDGITACVSMREYLKRYGIQTVGIQKIQYGNLEYAITKPSEDILPVLVDFAHGKVFMKIHTDHHDSQISYDNSSKNFRHAPSNAGTISAIISPTDIFPQEDVRIINMVDSAGYKDENVSVWDMISAVLKTDKTKTAWNNHLKMGMITNKLLLAFKNKPDFWETVAMNSGPSLLSMYQTIIKFIKEKIENGEKGYIMPDEVEKNSQKYYDQQNSKKILDGDIKDIDTLSTGTAIKIGNCVMQVGSGYVTKTGMYDRYTVFRLYPEVKYMVMCWDSMGMIQVSKNPWGEKDDSNLGELVIDTIFNNVYKPLLNNPKYNVSLLTLKRYYESAIKTDKAEESVGFNYGEMMSLFKQKFDFLTDKQQKALQIWMNWTKKDFEKAEPTEEKELTEKDEERNNKIDRVLAFLNSIKIQLPQIIELTSGGHPSITNLSGFHFIEEQRRVDRMLSNGENPMKDVQYTPKPKLKSDTNQNENKKFDSTSVKIMKSICKDIVQQLNVR